MIHPKDIVLPVENQLNAYNDRDLDAFCACFHDEVIVRDFPSGTIRIRGMRDFRSRYETLFRANPLLNCRLVQRIVIGNIVIDEEIVTGLADDVVHAVAIYQVQCKVIVEVSFIRP